MDEIEDYLGKITDKVKESFWQRIETDVIPEVRSFMKKERSANMIIQATIDVAVALALKEVAIDQKEFLRIIKL